MAFGERVQIMPQNRQTAEEIIQHFRAVEIEWVKGASLEEAAKKVGVTPKTLAQWQAEFGGLRVDQAKRLKELERENSRIRKIVSDQISSCLNRIYEHSLWYKYSRLVTNKTWFMTGSEIWTDRWFEARH